MFLQRMIVRSASTAAIVMAAGDRAHGEDPFETTLTMHRVRCGQTAVNGTLNVAFGPGLMNPATGFPLPHRGEQPPIHEINLVARCPSPMYVPVDPAHPLPLELFSVVRSTPSTPQALARRSEFGALHIGAGEPVTRVYQDVQVGEIRTISRATSKRHRD